MKGIVLMLSILATGSLAILRSSNLLAPTPSADYRKKNSGPPEEFHLYKLPDPRQGGVTTSSSVFPVLLSPSSSDASRVDWEGSVPVDSTTLVQLTLLTRLTSVKVDVQMPGMTQMIPADEIVAKLAETSGKVLETEFGMDGNVVPSVTYYFNTPVRGSWKVKISADVAETRKFDEERRALFLRNKMNANAAPELPHIFLIAFNESPYSVDSYLHSYESLRSGQGVKINGAMALSTLPRGHADAILAPGNTQGLQVSSAVLELYQPDGSQKMLQMKDDGNGHDLMAGDGIYAAMFEATEVGSYVAQVSFTGTTPEGHPFTRSSMHLLQVVRSDISVTEAYVTEKDAERFIISLVTPLSTTSLEAGDDVTHRAYAEVWGTPVGGGALIPVAWVSSMTDLAPSSSGKLAFELELNARWVEKAGATEPLELRNVYVQERNAWVPVAEHSTVHVVNNGVVARKLALRKPMLANVNLSEITEEMRVGVNPYKNGQHRSTTTHAAASAAKANLRSSVGADPSKPAIVLVHGYCAPANNFPPEEFTNSFVFEDFNQNRPTDLFARLIRDAGEPFTAGFAVVAHSHGGLASTHLNAAYFSNLNVNDNGQAPLVQSLGSPYQGVPVAGFLAGVGKVLGMGCGTAEDMTYDGAKLWLAGVPANQRTDTSFYVTMYDNSGFGIHYCVLAANAVLKWPNDGLTEVENNELPGGKAMGVTKGQCHSRGMKFMCQALDKSRNAIINAAAKR